VNFEVVAVGIPVDLMAHMSIFEGLREALTHVREISIKLLNFPMYETINKFLHGFDSSILWSLRDHSDQPLKFDFIPVCLLVIVAFYYIKPFQTREIDAGQDSFFIYLRQEGVLSDILVFIN
jgi:hypothetical protein